MNIEVKINGVTGQGVSRLMLMLESQANTLGDYSQDIYTHKWDKETVKEESEVACDEFRFVRVLEISPEKRSNSFQVRLMVFLKVWDSAGGGIPFNRDPFLAIFRSSLEEVLPVPDTCQKVREIMESLIKLDGKTCPLEVSENSKGEENVVILEQGEVVTSATIMLKIYPRLRYLTYKFNPNENPDTLEFTSHLLKAKEIAESLE